MMPHKVAVNIFCTTMLKERKLAFALRISKPIMLIHNNKTLPRKIQEDEYSP